MNCGKDRTVTVSHCFQLSCSECQILLLTDKSKLIDNLTCHLLISQKYEAAAMRTGRETDAEQLKLRAMQGQGQWQWRWGSGRGMEKAYCIMHRGAKIEK